MTDDDEDLFAVRLAPKRVKVRKAAPVEICKPAPDYAKPMQDHAATGPVVSLACRCGALEEIKAPCPAELDCWKCSSLGTMRAYLPRFTPPAIAGRSLTARELKGMQLDQRA